MTTFSNYIQIVQREVDDTSVGARAVISQDIKEIYQEIMLSAYQYLVEKTYEDITPTGDQNYTPTPFTEINGVSYKTTGNFTDLKPMTYDEYLKKCLDTTDGTPSKYLAKGTQLILDRPVSTGTLRVFYQPVVEELTNEADVSLIPTRFDNVVKMGASYKFFAFDDNSKAVEYKALYEEALRNMILNLSTVQKPAKITFYGV